MFLEPLSIKWFTVYYLVLGIIAVCTGIFLIISPQHLEEYLREKAEDNQPPQLLRTILKYVLIFTIPCLILSIIPFSIVEFLFSLWSLVMVYLAGIHLVRWEKTRTLISEYDQPMTRGIRLAGAITLSAGLVMFLLSYLVLSRANIL